MATSALDARDDHDLDHRPPDGGHLPGPPLPTGDPDDDGSEPHICRGID